MSSRGSIHGRAGSHAEVAGLAQAIGDDTCCREAAPGTRSGSTENNISGGEGEDEPIYGRTYMPRKFKIAIALPPHNDVDVFAHDLGFIAIEEGGRIVGYNVVVGGGMGMTHGEPDTFPRTGDVIGFCAPDQAVGCRREGGDGAARLRRPLRPQACAAEIYHRAHGPRGVPRRTGTAAWLCAVAPRATSPSPTTAIGSVGRRAMTATWHYTLFVENGRVRDLAGLHAIAELGIGRFIITPNQNLVLADIPADRKAGSGGVAAFAWPGCVRSSGLRRNALACVALPTCGLALAESERYLPGSDHAPGRRTGEAWAWRRTTSPSA